jgi:uncharacterized protein with von Willebrand factor type A (vWA) domain
VQLAQQALQVAGLHSRTDFRAVLAACLIDRAEHRPLFEQAFELFWQDPDLGGKLPSKVPGQEVRTPPPENRRLADAMSPQAPPPPDEAEWEFELDAELSWNDRERLQQADFDTMSAEEWRQAKRLVAELPLVFAPLPSRRSQRAIHPGRADWRASMAAMARHGGELWDLRWRRPRTQPPPLVLLADISGSMSRYSRVLLHFAHALGHAGSRVESFVFGTRLTRTTRLLKGRDPDLAVGQVVQAVQDWSGGTRIAASLQAFNHRWARRVLPSQATLLLVSDGLEHGDTAALAFEMQRLRRSCRRLVWLNPLLRYERFEPRAGGVKAMLPHVDAFLPVHNLASLVQLVDALATPGALSSRR